MGGVVKGVCFASFSVQQPLVLTTFGTDGSDNNNSTLKINVDGIQVVKPKRTSCTAKVNKFKTSVVVREGERGLAMLEQVQGLGLVRLETWVRFAIPTRLYCKSSARCSNWNWNRLDDGTERAAKGASSAGLSTASSEKRESPEFFRIGRWYGSPDEPRAQLSIMRSPPQRI